MAQITKKPPKNMGKTTGKPTGAGKTESTKKEPVRFVPISREKLLAALEATREQDQPVLDYLKDK